MNTKKIIVILSLVFLAFDLMAIDHLSLIETGNKAYEDGNFAEAIVNYEKVLAAEKTSSSLHYNLGSAYFNEKIYGQAVLHFEKARQLSPRDDDILHNLEYTKLFIKDRFELPESMPLVAWFMTARSSLSLLEIKTLEMIFFGLLIMGFSAFRIMRDRAAARSILVITIFVFGLFLIVSGWLVDRSLATQQQHGVVLVKEISVTSAPIGGSSTLFVIHEGTSGEILDATDAWYKIRLADGKTGWVVNEVIGIY